MYTILQYKNLFKIFKIFMVGVLPTKCPTFLGEYFLQKRAPKFFGGMKTQLFFYLKANELKTGFLFMFLPEWAEHKICVYYCIFFFWAISCLYYSLTVKVILTFNIFNIFLKIQFLLHNFSFLHLLSSSHFNPYFQFCLKHNFLA